jgi:hypothetical protein
MTSPRLPLVKAQRSFLSGIRLSRELHGSKMKVKTPPIKKNGSSELSGFYHSIFDFLASYRVSKYKKQREITRRNNKLKKMDSIQEKALKMAFIINCMYKSKIFSFHFKSSRSFNDV